jgi:Reverse transcriptase (RNA-dependent DNA polymerase)
MPLDLRRWIFNWLQGRKMSVSHGNAKSRSFSISIGAPQGSVLAALLFRLHIHYLPSHFLQTVCHLFADDLTIIIKGGLEMRLSANIKYLESQARVVLKALETFSDNHILAVNVSKTKAMIVHSAVDVQKPVIKYKDVNIEYVTSFKCLGVEIGTKLGMGKNIEIRLKKVRSSYCALRQIFHTIPKSEIKIRRQLFCAYTLPHFSWLFPTWFYFTEKQREKIEHVFMTGIRLVYSLWGYEDFTTLALSREFSLRDYLYRYWLSFQKHLEEASEAIFYRQTWNAFLIATSPNKDY